MNHKELIHYFLKQRISNSHRVVDMTCGNGYDTCFLASYAKEVYAVDIQAQAIENTKIRCQDKSNVKYFNMDHSDINFHERIDGAVYNLGYLPSTDKLIITQKESTLKSLNKIISKKPKYLTIAAYPGHHGGAEEYIAVREYLNDLELEFIEIRYTSENSPVSFLVDFVEPSSTIIHVDELKHLPQKMAWKIIRSTLQSS